MAQTSDAADKAVGKFVVPEVTQLAALCWRATEGDRREILLVTSSAGRWILPKGWPMRGKSDGEAALTEAWEEAGVSKGKVGRRPLGHYIGVKAGPRGVERPCLTYVYAVKVARTKSDWPEAERRDRRWVSPETAAALVTEDGLREIIARF